MTRLGEILTDLDTGKLRIRRKRVPKSGFATIIKRGRKVRVRIEHIGSYYSLGW